MRDAETHGLKVSKADKVSATANVLAKGGCALWFLLLMGAMLISGIAVVLHTSFYVVLIVLVAVIVGAFAFMRSRRTA
jgi:hypothetical protein